MTNDHIRTGRRVLLILGGVCLLWGAARLVTMQGWWRPVRIASGSMADALWGAHWLVTCADCGYPFRCGVDFPPDHDRPVCPNCGWLGAPLDGQSVRPGRRVWIDRAAFWWRVPRAWEAIAFRDPASGSRTVKRVVAGPGHQVALADGDVLVDGRVLTKSLAQLRAVAIRVHDGRFRSSAENRATARWRPRSTATGWRAVRNGYRYRPRDTAGPVASDWLAHHQWTCRPNPSPPAARIEEGPVLDDYAYNQGLSRGRLHPVHDLLLQCQLELSRPSQFRVRLADRGHVFVLVLEPRRGVCRLLDNGRPVAERRYRFPRGVFTLEMATCDRRLLVAINRLPTFTHPYVPDPAPAPVAGEESVLAVAAGGGDVLFAAPRILRDVFYLGPGGSTRWQRTEPVPAGHWFVLGDNVPVSVDSRYGVCVPHAALIGPVVTRE